MKKMYCVLILFLLLALVSNSAFAATTYVQWTGAANDGGNWNTPGNWNGGVVPIAKDLGGVMAAPGYKAGFKTPGNYANLSSGTVTTDILVFGGTNAGNLDNLVISGATVNVSEYITLAAAATDNGIVRMNSGTISTGVQIANQPFYVTQLGTGTLYMNGGSIYVGNYQTPVTPLYTGTMYMTGQSGITGNGTLYLNGGIIYANDLLPGTSGTARSLVVKDGLLVLKTDRTAALAGYSWLTAAAGYNLHTAFDADGGITTVWATPIPEPATICLLSLGMLGLIRRKK
jgi:hypothetical protein